MFDAISPSSEPAALPVPGPAAAPAARSGVPMRGRLALSFRRRGEATAIGRLEQTVPCRALFPRAARGEPRQAALVNVAGGLVGGDSLDIAIRAEPLARGLVTTPAAEKVYRSAGPAVSVDTRLTVEREAMLEWMPQPTILFDGAVLDRRTRIDLDPSATLLAGEVLVFGRAAHGERLAHGRLFDDWSVRIGGTLAWVDRLRVGDWPATLAAPAGLDGATAFALFLYAAPDAGTRLDAARELLEAAPVASAASLIGPVLVARWIDRDAARLLGAYTRFWSRFRVLAGAGAPILPTLWQT